VRLIALLSWYDEPVQTLIASIASLKVAGVDHVVAVDGAYALYPDGEPQSDANQQAIIHMTCRELGMGCTMHVPARVWAGNEPEKRTALFTIGWAVARPGDWFLVHDADTVVTEAPDDLKDRLADTEMQTAIVNVHDMVAARIKQRDLPEYFEYCGLFRAQPITVGPHHAQYRAADGQYLWVGNGERASVPALDLTRDVEIEHRPDHRPPERLLAKDAYYTNRDEARVERGDCSRCDGQSVRLVPTNWRWTRLGPVADWAEACEPCATKLEKRSNYELFQLGIDPDSVTLENRNGRAPAQAR
jgi:hypothetical protein